MREKFVLTSPDPQLPVLFSVVTRYASSSKNNGSYLCANWYHLAWESLFSRSKQWEAPKIEMLKEVLEESRQLTLNFSECLLTVGLLPETPLLPQGKVYPGSTRGSPR